MNNNYKIENNWDNNGIDPYKNIMSNQPPVKTVGVGEGMILSSWAPALLIGIILETAVEDDKST